MSEDIAAMSYVKGLQEVGDGLYAYLQPDGGWGWSNAGLVVDGDQTLLVDTLYDLSLTEQMLSAMRRAVPAAAAIGTLVKAMGFPVELATVPIARWCSSTIVATRCCSPI